MKVLVADKISAIGVEFLNKQEGLEVVEAYGSTPEQVLGLVSDVDAIVVRSETKVTAEVMAAAPNLKVVGRAGVGVDNIDIAAATERGVIVVNTPSGNTIATAELTFTHMLCGTRPVAQACQSMKEGRWDRKKYSGSELFKKTLGVLGMGRIGAEVAKRAQAFGMEVLGYDPYLTEDRAKALGVQPVDLDTLFAQSDYITVHMPMTDTTRYMIDEGAIAKMKDGVRLFNCARGGIIKESALIAGLQSGKVASAGLDVFEEEPLKDSALTGFDNVVLTPHLGASTQEAQESVGLEVAEVVMEILGGGAIRNAINMPSVDPQTLQALAPFMALSEKLGTAVQQLAPEKVVKLVITYRGGMLDLDTTPLSRAIQKGYLRQISGIEVNDVNAPHILTSQGIEVETVSSNEVGAYTDLIEVSVTGADGSVACLSGTLIGGNKESRVVAINGRDVEVLLENTLMVFENDDLPGIVGHVGTVLGQNQVNIANMSLSRQSAGTLALNVVELDSVPAPSVLDELKGHSAIKEIKLIRFA